MFKRLCLLTLSFFALNASAQNLFFGSSPPAPKNSSSSSNGVLSAADFSKQSASIAEQNTEKFNKQMGQKTTKPPAPSTLGLDAPMAKPSDQTTTTTTAIPLPPPPTEQTVTQTVTSAPVQTQALPPPTPPIQSAPSQQRNVYTGFGQGNKNQNPSGTSSGTQSKPASSGWNIKY